MTKAKDKETKAAAAKDTKDVKDTSVEDLKEQNKDAVGTAAAPKPPEPGSVGMNDGSKSNVNEEPGIDTNVREGAGIADGNERIGLNDGTVGTRDDLAPGSTVIGEGNAAAGTPDDREPEPVAREGLSPAELNPTPSTDPAINSLFGGNQAPSPTLDNVPAGTTVGDEAPGMTPEDERLVGVPTDLMVPLKATMDRITVARDLGHAEAADRAIKDLYEALGPVDAGQASALRDWANEQRDGLAKDNEKAAKKAARDRLKAQEAQEEANKK